MSNTYTELEAYRIGQAKRTLLDAYVSLNDDVRNTLKAIDAKTDGLDRVLEALADYSLFFERCYWNDTKEAK